MRIGGYEVIHGESAIGGAGLLACVLVFAVVMTVARYWAFRIEPVEVVRHFRFTHLGTWRFTAGLPLVRLPSSSYVREQSLITFPNGIKSETSQALVLPHD